MTRKRSNHVQRKITSRKPQAKVDPHVEEQFLAGRLLGTEAAGILVHNVTCMGSWPRVSLLSLSLSPPQPVCLLAQDRVGGVMATS